MKFAVTIVTYNRLELLKECVQQVLSQTVPFFYICIVDNNSTDGTSKYLDQLVAETQTASSDKNKPEFHILHLPENIGGAGGFAKGIENLGKTDCDWILIIDDDAMIAADYIEQLQKAILRTNYLAYSGTVTTAGSIDTTHRRFIKCPRLMLYGPVPEEAYAKASFEYDISTFCGLLVKADMVRRIGLPKTEYFIWFDDTEYCLRFHDQSRILNVTTAVLNHKTTPASSAPAISWKNYYGFRNAIDIGKTYSKNPRLYMAYIWLNHKAHIFLDTLGLLFGDQKQLRRYRIKIYKDVLKNRHKTPDGKSPDYLPGSGYKII